MFSDIRNAAKIIPVAPSKLLAVFRSVFGPTGMDQDSVSQQIQTLLLAQYRFQFAQGTRPHEAIRDAGFRCYSQFEEDGIILYILSAIGMGSRRVVEIGCGSGSENMSTNLILNHGFEGFLFDGSQKNIHRAEIFFKRKKDCVLSFPSLCSSWITRENVNSVLSDSGVPREVDVLSLDIDGNDWHILEALTVTSPKLLVLESHDIIPDGLSLTAPYMADFGKSEVGMAPKGFHSASLGAMVKLCRKKGYRLIGSHRFGFNVFFLKNEIAADLFPEVSIEEVQNNPWSQAGQKTQWPQVKDLNWLSV